MTVFYPSRAMQRSWTTQSSLTSSPQPWRTKEKSSLETCLRSMSSTIGKKCTFFFFSSQQSSFFLHLCVGYFLLLSRVMVHLNGTILHPLNSPYLPPSPQPSGPCPTPTFPLPSYAALVTTLRATLPTFLPWFPPAQQSPATTAPVISLSAAHLIFLWS